MHILAETCCTDYDENTTSQNNEREPIVHTGSMECPRDVTVVFVGEPLSPSDVTVADALLGI